GKREVFLLPPENALARGVMRHPLSRLRERVGVRATSRIDQPTLPRALIRSCGPPSPTKREKGGFPAPSGECTRSRRHAASPLPLAGEGGGEGNGPHRSFRACSAPSSGRADHLLPQAGEGMKPCGLF